MTDDDLQAFSLPDDATHPADIAARLMTLPEHQPLAEHDVQFAYLMRNTSKEKGGAVELGSVHVVKTMAQGGFKDLFLQLLAAMLGDIPQFIVVLDAQWWRDASPIERDALLFHELSHVKQALDQFGALKFDREGFPVWRLVEHDITAFNAEVTRYGAWHNGIAGFLSAARNA